MHTNALLLRRIWMGYWATQGQQGVAQPTHSLCNSIYVVMHTRRTTSHTSYFLRVTK
jgi:hypothetical protein